MMLALYSRLRISAVCLAVSTMTVVACGDNNEIVPDAAPIDAPLPVTARVVRTDLVSDIAAPGVTADPLLVNPWGVAFNPAGPIWVADNHSGVATVYDSTGAILPLVVQLPVPVGDTSPAAPTGQNFNPIATDFLGDKFILSTEDGTILGWQSGTTASLRADRSGAGALYKGFDILDTGTQRLRVAANFAKNQIDVFDSTYHVFPLSVGAFVDPNPIPGFAPFNVMVAGGNVYVSYAMQDALRHDDVAGPGNGAINVFDSTGRFVRRLITGGVLNSPWAMAIAPLDYPAIGGDLVVGNFGDGAVNAIDPVTGTLRMEVLDVQGNPLFIPGLWTLRFGNDQVGESHLRMFFSAGPAMETHGVLGRLDIAP